METPPRSLSPPMRRHARRAPVGPTRPLQRAQLLQLPETSLWFGVLGRGRSRTGTDTGTAVPDSGDFAFPDPERHPNVHLRADRALAHGLLRGSD